MRRFSADMKNPTVKICPREVRGLMHDACGKVHDPKSRGLLYLTLNSPLILIPCHYIMQGIQ